LKDGRSNLLGDAILHDNRHVIRVDVGSWRQLEYAYIGHCQVFLMSPGVGVVDSLPYSAGVKGSPAPVPTMFGPSLIDATLGALGIGLPLPGMATETSGRGCRSVIVSV
jgi:hypothetical protein